MPASRRDHASGAAGASQRAKHTRKQVNRDIRYREQLARGDIAGPPIGNRNCWCGKPTNHDWPGKAEGQVHPR